MQKLLSSLGPETFLLRYGDLPLPRHMLFEQGGYYNNSFVAYKFILCTGVMQSEITKQPVFLPVVYNCSDVTSCCYSLLCSLIVCAKSSLFVNSSTNGALYKCSMFTFTVEASILPVENYISKHGRCWSGP